MLSKDSDSPQGATGDNYCCFLSRQRHAYTVWWWGGIFYFWHFHRRLVNARITNSGWLRVISWNVYIEK